MSLSSPQLKTVKFLMFVSLLLFVATARSETNLRNLQTKETKNIQNAQELNQTNSTSEDNDQSYDPVGQAAEIDQQTQASQDNSLIIISVLLGVALVVSILMIVIALKYKHICCKDESQVKKLIISKLQKIWKKKKSQIQINRELDCPICIDKNVNTILPCGHWGHYDCLAQWYKKKVTCPMCRQKSNDFAIYYCTNCNKKQMKRPWGKSQRNLAKYKMCDDCYSNINTDSIEANKKSIQSANQLLNKKQRI